MVPDDFARLGELMRRDGVWRGRRLLSERYVRESLTPLRASGCYGWLIWLNAGRPCVGVRITSRSVTDARRFPGLPEDAFFYSGLFGQLVTVFPSQRVIIERSGVDAGSFAGGADWEGELYRRVLGAITDQPVPVSGEAPATSTPDASDPDEGFQTSLTEPDQFLAPILQTKLPPAGPWRARALQLDLAAARASRDGVIRVRAVCPRRWPAATIGTPRRCEGRVKLAPAARSTVPVSLAAGERTTLRFRLKRAEQRTLTRRKARSYTATATVRDASAGTRSSAALRVLRPLKRR
jgi:hypothetical protein